VEDLLLDPLATMHPSPLTPGLPLVDGSFARFDALVSEQDSKEQWMEQVRTGSGSWCTDWRKSYTLVELSGVQIE